MNNNKKKHSFPFFGSCALLISDKSELLQPELILKLPYMYSITLAGTFLLEKEGIMEIVENANKRAFKVVLLTHSQRLKSWDSAENSADPYRMTFNSDRVWYIVHA